MTLYIEALTTPVKNSRNSLY